MRNQRNTVLAGIAALGLLAGTTLAWAQAPQDHNGAQKGKHPQAAQTMNKPSASGKMSQSAGPKAQKQNPQARMDRRGNMSAKAATGKNRSAQMQRPKSGTMARHEGTKARTTAQQRNLGKNTTAQGDRKGMAGLQGNASGMNVRLNDEQRTQIRTTVLNARGAPRLGNANFNVTVGTVVPRSGVRIVPVPTTLVRIEPTWRGFRYFVWMDDIVIVNPRDMTIIAVIPV